MRLAILFSGSLFVAMGRLGGKRNIAPAAAVSNVIFFAISQAISQ
jgi:hypothetical protein